MQRKLIATDLDGTVVFAKESQEKRHELYMKPDDTAAIKKLQEAGHLVAVCTGRPKVGIQEFLNLSKLTFDYYIATNGALIYDKNWNILYKKTIPQALCLEIVETIMRYHKDMMLSAFTEDNVYNFCAPELGDEENILLKTGVKMTIEELQQQQLEFVEFAMRCTVGDVHEQFEKMKQLELVLKDQFDGRLHIYRNNAFIDFSPLGVSKGKGIKRLAKLTKIPLEYTVGIGDSWNDLSMLQEAGKSYTFHHAEESLKPHATHVVEAFSEMAEQILEKA